MTHVPDEGSLRASIVLVGEAPGEKEVLAGRPFIGPSGNRLAVWWRGVGLERADFYITNVLPYRPDNIDKVPREEMEEHIRALHERLAQLEHPVIIVPTGNYALYALTGKGKVSWHRKDGKHERPGIMDWRGSILQYPPESTVRHRTDRVVKVIPTIHPAHILRNPGLERRALLDWRRIAEELEHVCRDGVIYRLPCVCCAQLDSPLNLPQRDHHIRPTVEDVELFVADALQANLPLSIDIETPKGSITEFQLLNGTWARNVKRTELDRVARYKSGKKKGQPKSRVKKGYAYIGCIGFAFDTSWSLTIPLTLDYWKSRDKLERVKALVNKLLASPLPKVMQNGMFDSTWLLHEGYEVNNWIWDTRAMHHALDPRDDHDLAYMASVLTRQPFWKHEAKDPDEITKYASNSEALWTYNGIDVCVTLEIFYTLHAKLKEQGLLPFYRRHYANMMPVLLDMTAHGVKVDDATRQRELDVLDERAAILLCEAHDLAGMNLVAKKGLSNDRLKFLLYGAKGFPTDKAMKTFNKIAQANPGVTTFNLPPVYKKNTKGGRSITCDEVALRKLILRYPAKLGELGPKLLDYRRNRKVAEFLDKKALDRDLRLRCQYSFVTEAGRLASQANPRGTGRNLQNIDRELRHVFIPDDDPKEESDAKVS